MCEWFKLMKADDCILLALGTAWQCSICGTISPAMDDWVCAGARDCLSRPELCEWFNFTNSEDSSLALNKLMASAWYVLQPSGDFLSRSAWYDGIMTVSIPVVFQARYPEYQPYNDVIDYSKMMVTLPEVGSSHWLLACKLVTFQHAQDCGAPLTPLCSAQHSKEGSVMLSQPLLHPWITLA